MSQEKPSLWHRFVGQFKHQGDHVDDDKILADMGYVQELFRGVTGSFMNYAFTFSAVSIISSYSILYGSGITTGGPSVMIWTWIVGSFFTILVGLSMSEICSTYPSAGSVYHWAGQLTSKERAPFASYITGWFNFLGNAAGDASFAAGFAQIVASAIAIEGPTLDVGPVVGISILVLFVWTLNNCMNIQHQGYIISFAAVYQVVSSIIIIIVVLAAIPVASRSSGEFVFTKFNNETGLDVPGYVVLIGLLTTLFTFSGYEAGAHIAEETQGARIAAPRGIISCCLIGAGLGIIYILGLLFATPECNMYPDNPLSNCTTDIVSIYTLNGNTQGLALTSLLIINLFFAGTSSITVTTRIGFAMARDGAFPGSRRLAYIYQTTKSPLGMVFFVFVVDALLLLLPLANPSAFNAIVSITTIGFQISYAIPIILRVTSARHTFKKNAFHLGRFSIVIGWISSIWLVSTSTLFFWPAVFPVDETNMNYTIVVVGGTLIIALFFWFVAARKYFVGPKRSDEDPSELALQKASPMDASPMDASI